MRATHYLARIEKAERTVSSMTGQSVFGYRALVNKGNDEKPMWREVSMSRTDAARMMAEGLSLRTAVCANGVEIYVDPA